MLSPRTRARAAADKPLADEEGLGQAIGTGLLGVFDAIPTARRAQQFAEARQVQRGGDEQDLTDAGQHQGASG